MALRNNFRVTKKLLITKFDCIFKSPEKIVFYKFIHLKRLSKGPLKCSRIPILILKSNSSFFCSVMPNIFEHIQQILYTSNTFLTMVKYAVLLSRISLLTMYKIYCMCTKRIDFFCQISLHNILQIK